MHSILQIIKKLLYYDFGNNRTLLEKNVIFEIQLLASCKQ